MNRTRARKIINGAAAVGDLHALFYFVEMTLPASLRPPSGAATMAASYPAGWVPVVPLAPDPDAARHYVHLMLELMASANRGRGIVLSVELTAPDILEDCGVRWYVWGEPIPALVDAVCPVCGGVRRVAVGAVLDCCPASLAPLGVGAGMYAGQWWGGA